MADNKTIVSRIQHRRGLKQDLPQPLRPGEIGLAVDSRQVYIGGDPTNPNSVDFDGVSYFEASASAKDHVISIANNNILAFQVPFVKYKKGEFNGINKNVQWLPTEARSTTSSGKAGHYYSSSLYPIFSPTITNILNYEVKTLSSGSTTVYVKPDPNASTHSDSLGNIRVGDIVFNGDIVTPTDGNVFVTGVSSDPTGGYIVTMSTQQSLSADSNISFRPVSIKNYNTGEAFKNDEVIVRKNGIKLIPEANNTLSAPSAVADFVLDGSRIVPNEAHYLTLRTPPSTTDEVSVSYYSNANVIQSFTGINGNIAVDSSVKSFYNAYDIPSYRQIPTENVRLSEDSGLGYVAFDTKHITSVADGANVSSTQSLSMGNLMISRNDLNYATSSVVVDDTYTNPVITINLTLTSQNDFSPVGDGGVYRYNRAYLKDTNVNSYLNNRLLEVAVSDGSSAAINVSIPTPEFVISRGVSVALKSGSSYGTSSEITVTPTNGDVDGLTAGDYVRFVTLNNDTDHALQDTILKVTHVNATTNSFNVSQTVGNLHSGNSAVNFQSGDAGNHSGNLAIINHGDAEAKADTHLQLYSPAHTLPSGVTEITITRQDRGGSVEPLRDGSDATSEDYPISDITDNTFFVDLTGIDNMATAGGLDEVSGAFMANLAASYSTVTVSPILAIDLRNNTSIASAITTVNQRKVSIPAVDASNDVTIFPELNWLPQDDESLNAVYVQQRSAFSSLDAGGLEFTLHEDTVNTTLSVLGLTAGSYTRDNSSVRAKLEKWMNSLINSRDVQLFTNVFTGGTPYATFNYTDSNPKSLYNGKSNIPNDLGRYNLEIDQTYGEVFFASRTEASHFNYLTNNLYAESSFDRASDDKDGSRGIINLKNNLEIQTREAAAFGEKIESYESLEQATILLSHNENTTVLSFETSVYNTFVLDYTLVEQSGSVNKYLRTGTMHISARPDFTSDPTNAVILSDRFSSTWEVTHSDPIVEPKFEATMSGSSAIVKMDLQYSDPANPGSGTVVHSIGSNLKMKYVVRRWSSTA